MEGGEAEAPASNALAWTDVTKASRFAVLLVFYYIPVWEPDQNLYYIKGMVAYYGMFLRIYIYTNLCHAQGRGIIRDRSGTTKTKEGTIWDSLLMFGWSDSAFDSGTSRCELQHLTLYGFSWLPTSCWAPSNQPRIYWVSRSNFFEVWTFHHVRGSGPFCT